MLHYHYQVWDLLIHFFLFPSGEQRIYIAEHFSGSNLEFQETANEILESLKQQDRQQEDVVDPTPEEDVKVIQIKDGESQKIQSENGETVIVVPPEEGRFTNVEDEKINQRNDQEETEEKPVEEEEKVDDSNTQEAWFERINDQDLYGWMTDKERKFWSEIPEKHLNKSDELFEGMLKRIETRVEARKALMDKKGASLTSEYLKVISKNKKDGLAGIKTVGELTQVPYMGMAKNKMAAKFATNDPPLALVEVIKE